MPGATKDTLPLFHDLPDEKLLGLCQHLQLFTVEQGECYLPQQITWTDGQPPGLVSAVNVWTFQVLWGMCDVLSMK